MKTSHRFFAAASVACLALCAAAPAHAEDVNGLVKSKILGCLHPSVDAAKASVETQPAKTEGDIATTRVKVFYAGMLKKNSLEMDVLVRSSGSIRQFKANVLSDTGMSMKTCAMTQSWTDF